MDGCHAPMIPVTRFQGFFFFLCLIFRFLFLSLSLSLVSIHPSQPPARPVPQDLDSIKCIVVNKTKTKKSYKNSPI
ncbi:hypothetical protein QBC43DRAFT_311731, partial [Cladorrhinum sp. PSN259]